MINEKPSSYRASGVDIDAGQALVENIKPYTQKTLRPEVMGNIGGFGALFALPIHRYQEPILVSGTDGVGTKLKLAITTQKHDTIGIDLVAMCVNDILTLGAEPLFFLDYYATGQLNVTEATQVIKGIAQGCEQAHIALIGGETAEMPGMYQAKDYDLAGFCVGIVEKNKIIDGQKIKVGDSIIGIQSSGPHANGYSLIRALLPEDINITLADGHPLIDHLLAPTKIYVKPILTLLEKLSIHGLAHITGGGILENIPRILPQGVKASIHSNSWQWPLIFQWLQQQGNISNQEMYRTFNCGIGMVVMVSPQEEQATLDILAEQGEQAMVIGQIQEQTTEKTIEIL